MFARKRSERSNGSNTWRPNRTRSGRRRDHKRWWPLESLEPRRLLAIDLASEAFEPAITGAGNSFDSSISDDGRYVAFVSEANNLVTGDTNSNRDIFVRDLATGATTLVGSGVDPSISGNGQYVAFASRDSNGAENDPNGSITDIFIRDLLNETTTLVTSGADSHSSQPSISGDGRYVVFASRATNLATGDTNGDLSDIFIYDRTTGETTLVATDEDQEASEPSISADGRYIAFRRQVGQAAPSIANDEVSHIFVHDRTTDTTTLVTSGADGDSFGPSISDDGQFVAFVSSASSLVANDSNGYSDVFIREVETGGTTLVTPGSTGESHFAVISGNGQFVAFASSANLVMDDSNGMSDIFLYDRSTSTTTWVTSGSDGESSLPSISADGGHVAFDSHAKNLVASDFNEARDVFVYHRDANEIALASQRHPLALDRAGNGSSIETSISSDGRYVAFTSGASNLTAVDDTNGTADIFVRDMVDGTTTLLTAGADRDSYEPSISADGRYVAFASYASNLVEDDPNGFDQDIFVHDRETGITTLLTSGANGSSFEPAISADGRYVVFSSFASNLTADQDTNNSPDVFLHDTITHATMLLTLGADNGSAQPSISADGRYVAFQSFATNLTAEQDSNDTSDIFLYDRDLRSTARLTIDADSSSSDPSISADGRHVAFLSFASNLVPSDPNGHGVDIFVYERETKTTTLLTGVDGSPNELSISGDGRYVAFSGDGGVILRDRDRRTSALVTADADGESYRPAISADGRHIAFGSNASNLVEGIYARSSGDGQGAIPQVYVFTSNQPPTAKAQSIPTQEDREVTIELAGSDADGDSLTFEIVTLPEHGTLAGTAPYLTYTPTLNFNGTDSFTFRAHDGFEYGEPAAVSINVEPVNDPPQAFDVSFATSEDTQVFVSLLANDLEGDFLTFAFFDAGPNHGVVSAFNPSTGTFTYTPDDDFFGTDVFSYLVFDDNANSNAATVSITIESVTDTFVVDSAIDEDDGDYSIGDFSLREAIARANLSHGFDIIEFAPGLAGETITLTLGQLVIVSDLTITGLGADQLAISGNGSSRVLNVMPKLAVDVSGLTIRDGIASDDGGGGISNQGTLSVLRSTISGNTGGGIANSGSMTIIESTISNNSVHGGIINGKGAILSISASTISGNSGFSGGGIINFGGGVTITETTISGNSALSTGGGVFNQSGPLTLQNTIVAANVAKADPDVEGNIKSLGNNLIGVGDGIIWAESDLVGTMDAPLDPLLGPLADNGGPTQTHALLVGSPAIDVGGEVVPGATDQRGIKRPQDGNGDGVLAMDIGAYELEANARPIADAGGPYLVEAGMELHLDASSSSDPDAGDQIVRYEWDLNNDGLVFEIDTTSPETVVPWDDFQSLGLGTHTITLRVTDSFGAVDTATADVTIRDTTPPVFEVVPENMTVEASGPAGVQVFFVKPAARDLYEGHVSVSLSVGSGTVLPLGLTTVELTASDTSGNQVTSSFTVNVVDTTPPTLTLPSDLTLEATNSAGAIATFSATATDAVDVEPTIAFSHASGSQFLLGETTVTVTATDDAGNVTSGAFKVFVVDTMGPALVLPANQTFEATSAAGALVTFNEATSPDQGATITYSPANGSQFALGSTTVFVTATDGLGNESTGTFTVSVVDTTTPAVTPPPDITAEATAPNGAVVTFTATATDAVSSPTIVYSSASGSVFPLGQTSVLVTATDAAGNSSQTSFNVSVRDTTAPVLNLPADITVDATSAAGAVVTFTASATDAVDGQPALSFSHASGSQFALGETTVTITATDDFGNAASGSFKVFVVDTTGPTLALPANQTFEATSAAGALVTFSEATSPDADATITYSPANGSQFPLGATTVLVAATDSLGNESTGTFEITVHDTTPPELTPPADITVDATSPAGASVTFTASATDAVDQQPALSFSHASGSQFALGETTVTITATDDAGNTTTDDFTITVVQPTPSSGITTVQVINGQLVITGDGGENIVAILGIGTGTGIYDVTTEQGTQRFSGVTGGISIDLAGGNDQLGLNLVYVAGAIDIQTGDGNDTVVLGDNNVVSSAGDLNINLGAGNDTLDGKRLYIGANQIIHGGDGDDRMIFDGFLSPQFTLGTSAAGNASWFGGSGDDTVHVIYAFIVGAFSVDLGAGADLFDIFGSAVSGNVSIFGRGGDDTLKVDTNFFDADLVMEGNEDRDTLFLANGLGTETARLSGGSGPDSITVQNQTASRLDINAGGGADQVNVRASAFDRFFASLGDDNDELTVHGNLVRLEIDFDGGPGNADRLVDLGNGLLEIYERLGFEVIG